MKQIEMRTGKTASDEELAKQLGLTDEELCSWQTQLKVTNVVSLNEFEENGPEPMIDSAHPVRFSQPEEVVEEAELKEKLAESLELLTEKERRVIELYYYEDMTLKEISKILEVSEYSYKHPFFYASCLMLWYVTGKYVILTLPIFY